MRRSSSTSSGMRRRSSNEESHFLFRSARPLRTVRGQTPDMAKRDTAMRVWPGHPFPLGPNWDGHGTNFSLFSENAERVELCLFDAHDHETRVPLTERTAFNWHVYLPGVGPG